MKQLPPNKGTQDRPKHQRREIQEYHGGHLLLRVVQKLSLVLVAMEWVFHKPVNTLRQVLPKPSQCDWPDDLWYTLSVYYETSGALGVGGRTPESQFQLCNSRTHLGLYLTWDCQGSSDKNYDSSSTLMIAAWEAQCSVASIMTDTWEKCVINEWPHPLHIWSTRLTCTQSWVLFRNFGLGLKV